LSANTLRWGSTRSRGYKRANPPIPLRCSCTAFRPARNCGERSCQIELFYLPGYSPQLNPEERLNADLKQEIGKRVAVRTKAKLREAANDHMAMLEQNPERVMSYFQDRHVRCAD
jgi:hypothetical protein